MSCHVLLDWHMPRLCDRSGSLLARCIQRIRVFVTPPNSEPEKWAAMAGVELQSRMPHLAQFKLHANSRGPYGAADMPAMQGLLNQLAGCSQLRVLSLDITSGSLTEHLDWTPLHSLSHLSTLHWPGSTLSEQQCSDLRALPALTELRVRGLPHCSELPAAAASRRDTHTAGAVQRIRTNDVDR